MKKPTISIIAITLGVCVLTLGGYLVDRWFQIPQVETRAVEDSATVVNPPSHRMVARQIRALTERNPMEAARDVWFRDDPWVYGMISGGKLLVPGIPNDSPIMTDRIVPVRVIAWTGLTAPGASSSALDLAAERYAEAFNLETVRILATN